MSVTTHAVAPRKTSAPKKGGEQSVKAERTKLDAITIIGRIASALSVIMYVSYITQIMNNLGGHPGTPWQPLAAFFNCTMWTLYGFLKPPKKDMPIIVANIPGIILGLITFITALVH